MDHSPAEHTYKQLTRGITGTKETWQQNCHNLRSLPPHAHEFNNYSLYLLRRVLHYSPERGQSSLSHLLITSFVTDAVCICQAFFKL